jgi:uncharacterized protein with WD repeat
VTYILPDKQSEIHNLCIWNIADGKKLAGWSLRNKFCWPIFQWTQDESVLIALLTKGTISFFHNNEYDFYSSPPPFFYELIFSFTQSTSHLSKARVTQFFVGPGKDPYICVFLPVKASGIYFIEASYSVLSLLEPAFIEVYKLSKPEIAVKKQVCVFSHAIAFTY